MRHQHGPAFSRAGHRDASQPFALPQRICSVCTAVLYGLSISIALHVTSARSALDLLNLTGSHYKMSGSIAAGRRSVRCGNGSAQSMVVRLPHWMALSHCSLVAFSASSAAFFFGSVSAAIFSVSSASCALSCSSKLDFQASASGSDFFQAASSTALICLSTASRRLSMRCTASRGT